MIVKAFSGSLYRIEEDMNKFMRDNIVHLVDLKMTADANGSIYAFMIYYNLEDKIEITRH